MSINAVTSLVVDSLYNSPYKGYYKKDYLAVIERLSKMGAGYFEDWMVDDFIREIVSGTDSLLKKYSKLGKAKQCAISMLEHYIFWTYEIGNKDEGDKIKKSFEDTTKLRYNSKKIADIIRYNTSPKEVVPNNKSVLIAITPPKNKCVRFNVEGVIYPPEKPQEEHRVENEVVFEEQNIKHHSNNFIWLIIFLALLILINYKDLVLEVQTIKDITETLGQKIKDIDITNEHVKESIELVSRTVNSAINETVKAVNKLY